MQNNCCDFGVSAKNPKWKHSVNMKEGHNIIKYAQSSVYGSYKFPSAVFHPTLIETYEEQLWIVNQKPQLGRQKCSFISREYHGISQEGKSKQICQSADTT
jgi:hypothetical protein